MEIGGSGVHNSPPSGAFTNSFPPRTYSPPFLSVAFIQSLFYGGNLKSAGELLAGAKGLEAVGHGDLDDEVKEGMATDGIRANGLFGGDVSEW